MLMVVTGIVFNVHWKMVGAVDDMSKRILLHSSDDLGTEITNLKALVQALETRLTGKTT